MNLVVIYVHLYVYLVYFWGILELSAQIDPSQLFTDQNANKPHCQVMCSLEALSIKAHGETELAVSCFCRLYLKSFITYQLSAPLTGENVALLKKNTETNKQKKGHTDQEVRNGKV